MYINTGYEITNTPSQIKAGYNTWPYTAPRSQWYQSNPKYYIDHTGVVREWNSWNPPQLVRIPGGMYKGTPTRTGGYYMPNTIISPQHVENKTTYFSGHY